MTYQELIKTYSKLAVENGLEDEAVKWLVLELSGLTNTEFYLNQKTTIEPKKLKEIKEKLELYIYKQIPIQHILGFSYFFGYKFIVNDDVLIPRRETEELTEEVLYLYDEYFSEKKIDVLDLGTGSGAIAITLAKEEPNMNVVASDISLDALKVAKENSLVLEANVKFIRSDWFKQIEGKFDIIVANPPYIPESEEVGITVQKEPNIALYGGKTGVEPYEIILSSAKDYMKDFSIIAFEHGYQQSEAIKHIALKYFNDAKIIQKKDMQQKDRMTFVVVGSKNGQK